MEELCPRLVQGMVTFLATRKAGKNAENAPGLSGGWLRSLLQAKQGKTPRMPPACPGDGYVPCYTQSREERRECPRLARGMVTFLATREAGKNAENAPGLSGGWLRSLLQAKQRTTPRMPPACPGDGYVPCYRQSSEERRECPRLARGMVTFPATRKAANNAENAPGLSGGWLRSLLQAKQRTTPRMPPACPGDGYVPCYRQSSEQRRERPRLVRGMLTFLAKSGRDGMHVIAALATSVRIPRASRGH